MPALPPLGALARGVAVRLASAGVGSISISEEAEGGEFWDEAVDRVVPRTGQYVGLFAMASSTLRSSFFLSGQEVAWAACGPLQDAHFRGVDSLEGHSLVSCS